MRASRNSYIGIMVREARIGDLVKTSGYPGGNMLAPGITIGMVVRQELDPYDPHVVVRYLIKADDGSEEAKESKLDIKRVDELVVIPKRDKLWRIVREYVESRSNKLKIDIGKVQIPQISAEQRRDIEEVHDLAGAKMDKVLFDALVVSYRRERPENQGFNVWK